MRIQLDHVSKVYPGSSQPAVDDVSLEIPAGEIVVFVGTGASLRQLGLLRVKDVDLRDHPAAHVADTVQSARNQLSSSGFEWLVLHDSRDGPVSWVRESRLAHAADLSSVAESLDVVSTQSTLEDALEAILTESHASAVVAGPGSRYVGVVTLETLIEAVTRLGAEASAEPAAGEGTP